MTSDRQNRLVWYTVTAISVILSTEMLKHLWRLHSQMPVSVIAVLACIHCLAIGSAILCATRGQVVLACSTQLLALLLQGPGLMWANHQTFGFWVLSATLLLYKKDKGNLSLHFTLKSMFALMIVWAGLQKLLHGQWLDGQFFAAMVAFGDPRFSRFFELLGYETLVRSLQKNWQSQQIVDVRQLPYLIKIVSSSIVFIEIIAPIGIFYNRYRTASLVIISFSLLGMQWITREYFFGAICLVMVIFIWQSGRTNQN